MLGLGGPVKNNAEALVRGNNVYQSSKIAFLEEVLRVRVRDRSGHWRIFNSFPRLTLINSIIKIIHVLKARCNL